MGDVTQLLAGAFTAYRKAHVTGGSDPVTGNTVNWTGWTAFGFQNEDGLSVNHDVEWLDANVQEFNSVVKSEPIKEDLQVGFMLLESDLQQMGLSNAMLTYAEGATPGTNPNTLVGGDKATPELFSLGFEGVSKDGNEEIWVFHRCLARGPSTWEGKKSDWRKTPFAWQVQTEAGKAAGQRLFKAYEITSA